MSKAEKLKQLLAKTSQTRYRPAAFSRATTATSTPADDATAATPSDATPAPTTATEPTTAPAGLRTFYGVLSTSQPVELYPGVFEQLSHEPGAVDLSRAAAIPLLFDHDMTRQAGAVSGFELDSNAGQLTATDIRLSRSQDALAADIEDGIRAHLSVGYNILDYDIKELPTGDLLVDVKRWQLIEVSSVATPRDLNASFTRSLGDAAQALTDLLSEKNNSTENVPTLPNNPAASTVPAAPVSRSTTQGVTKMEDIINLCTVAGRPDLIQSMIHRGLTAQQASKELLDLRAAATAAAASPALGNLSNSDSARVQRSYSLNAVMQAQAAGRPLSGLELEVHTELTRSRTAAHGGILVPLSARAYGTQSQDGLTPGVATTSRIATIEDSIVASSILSALGATFEADLPGSLTIPKRDGEVSMTWRGESPATALTPSNIPADTQVTMTPKLISGSAVTTIQMLQSAARLADPVTRTNKLFGDALALALDRAVFAGAGVAQHQPLGILNHPSVVSVDFQNAAITRSKLLEFEGTVKDALKGTSAAPLAYAITSQVQRLFEDTPAQPGTLSAELLYQNGKILGRNAQTTYADIGTDPLLVFGNFSKVRYGTAGTAELVVDPYTRAAFGELVYTMHALADAVVVRPEQFVIGTNIAV